MWRAIIVALAAGGVLLAVALPRAPSHSDALALSADPAPLSHTVSAGGNHNCGLRTDGTLACWGYNGYGQATPIAGTFTQVSAGSTHNCGVRTDGTLACWGDNYYGQATPSSGTFSQVSAGYGHTCGVRTDGTLACWGYNYYGQATPPSGAFSQVSAGYVHTCGVRTDGTLACWGYNYYGQATPPAGIFSQVSAGYGHTCGLRTDGTLACWGLNASGQADPPAGTFSQVSAGYGHTCGVRTDGTITCWGSNFYGQTTPPPAGTFSQISAGYWHNCAVRTDATLACWGYDANRQSSPPAGTIVIVKATAPAGGTGFGFSDNVAAPNSFSLDDGGTETFSNVFTDSYVVIEDEPQVTPGNFALNGLTCTDPDGGSSVDLSARKATIDLDAGETVTCTFTNTLGSPTPTRTPTRTPTPTVTPTPAITPCAGDSDCDGITDEVDTDLFAFSNDFTDEPLGGTTSGTIVDRGGLLADVSEEPNPDGVRTRASGVGGPARVAVCSNPQTAVELDPGNEVVVTCGSATVRVLSDPVTASFGSVIANLVAGTTVTAVETSPGTFDFSSSSSSGGPVVVGGLVLAPGETAIGVTDADADGLVDGVETNTGVFVDTTNTGTNPHNPDSDGDRLTDGQEVLVYHANPFVVDTDGDGCADGGEPAGAPAPKPGSTGAYNPLASYDFFDVPVPANPDMTPNGPKNQAVTMSDVLAVLRYVGTHDGDGGALNPNGVAYDSDKMGVGTKAGLAYDRSPSLEPNPPWDAGPPSGAVNMADVLAVLAQVGLSCAEPP